MTIEYQLGYYVGEYIYHTQLPTLSTDLLKSRKVIQVTIAEADEYHTLNSKWHKSFNGDNRVVNPDWEAAKEYRHGLAKKYLPHILECFVPRLEFKEDFNMIEFKKGLRFSLWDSDLCWYKIETDEDIEVIQEYSTYNTLINLKLDV